MKKNETQQINEIFSEYLHDKEVRNPLNDEPLSETKRLYSMYQYVSNCLYNRDYCKEARILACQLMIKILEEE